MPTQHPRKSKVFQIKTFEALNEGRSLQTQKVCGLGLIALSNLKSFQDVLALYLFQYRLQIQSVFRQLPHRQADFARAWLDTREV